MKNSQLVSILKCFNVPEFNRILLFVRSPFALSDLPRMESSIGLFRYLLKSVATEPDDGSLEKKLAAKRLFPNAKKPLDELEKNMSQLMGAVKRYIAWDFFVESNPENSQAQPAGEGSAKTKSKERALKENPLKFINFSRQGIAMLRFFNERITKRPLSESQNKTGNVSNPGAQNSGGAKRARHIEDFFENTAKLLKRYHDADFAEAEKGKPINYSEYSNRQFLEMMYHRFAIDDETHERQNLVEDARKNRHILETMHSLREFYLATRLDLALKLEISKHLLLEQEGKAEAIEREIEVAKQTLADFLKHDAERAFAKPLFEMYDAAFSLLDGKTTDPKNDAQTQIQRLRNLLERHSKAIPKEKAKDFCTITRNHCLKIYHQNRSLADAQLVFSLFEKHHAEGMLTHVFENQEHIHRSTIQSAITAALKVGKTDWAIAFLEAFPPEKITGTEQANELWGLNMANAVFQKRDFKKTQRLLFDHVGETVAERGNPDTKYWRYNYQSIKDDAYRNLAIRLISKTLYELDMLEDEESLNFFRAAKTWVSDKKNKKIKPETRTNLLNFFEAISKLGKKRNGGSLQDFEDIIVGVLANRTPDSEWFLGEAENRSLAVLRAGFCKNWDSKNPSPAQNSLGQLKSRLVSGEQTPVFAAECTVEFLEIAEMMMNEIAAGKTKFSLGLQNKAADWVKKHGKDCPEEAGFFKPGGKFWG